MTEMNPEQVFRKYPSIKNARWRKQMTFIEERMRDDTIFVVTEKIHGSNFGFIVTPKKEVLCFRRNGLLEEDDQFYNWREIRDKYAPILLELYETNMSFTNKTLRVYGELFGGYYDGVSEGTRIQKEVQYSTHNDFVVFDMSLDTEYLDFSDTCYHAMSVGLHTVPQLMSGTFEQCMEVSPEFITNLPNKFKLEELEDNYAEGVVIRPNVNIEMVDDEGRPQGRVMLKVKSSKFEEKEGRKSTPKVQVELPENMQHILDSVLEYITEARVVAVASKELELTAKDFGVIVKLTLEDALGDVRVENTKLGMELDELDKADFKTLNKIFTKKAASLVRKYFMSENVFGND